MFKISSEALRDGDEALDTARKCRNSIHCLWGSIKRDVCKDSEVCLVLKLRKNLLQKSPIFYFVFKKASDYEKFITSDYGIIVQQEEGNEDQKREVLQRFNVSMNDLYLFAEVSSSLLVTVCSAIDWDIPNISREFGKKASDEFKLHLHLFLEELEKTNQIFVNLLNSRSYGFQDVKLRDYIFLLLYILCRAIKEKKGIEFLDKPEEKIRLFQEIEEFIAAGRR